MNYIEIEIGGKKRGFRFGLGFLGNIMDHFDVDMEGLGKMMSKNPFKSTPAILYFGHEYEVRKQKGTVDFTMQDVDEWLDELEHGCFDEKLEPLFEVLNESTRKNVAGLLRNETDTKKKKK